MKLTRYRAVNYMLFDENGENGEWVPASEALALAEANEEQRTRIAELEAVLDQESRAKLEAMAEVERLQKRLKWAELDVAVSRKLALRDADLD